MRSRTLALVAIVALGLGCTDPVDGVDGGSDGGHEDAGTDAGLMMDAGTMDAGLVLDAGPVDAGFSMDAGPGDAGSDAGRTDAGFDAGPLDAGFDAGPPDAGHDAGTTDAGFDAGPSCVFETTGAALRITETGAGSTLQALAGNGAEVYVLVREDAAPSTHILNLYPAAEGQTPTALTTGTEYSFDADLAYSGSGFGMLYWSYETWPDDGIWFQPLDGSGAPSGARVPIDPNASGGPTIAPAPGGFALSWMNRTNSTARFVLVDAAGTATTTEQSLGTGHIGAVVAWTGTEYFAGVTEYSYADSDTTTTIRTLSAAGVPDTSTPIPGEGRGNGCCPTRGTADFAESGGTFALLRAQLFPETGASFFTIDSTGTVSPEVVIPSETAAANQMQLVSRGGGWTAAWSESSRIVLVVLDASGGVLERHEVSTAGTSPRLLRDGDDVVLGWTDHSVSDVYLQRFSPCR